MSVLEKLLADNWNAETSKAWNELWEMSATAMMKVPMRISTTSFRSQIFPDFSAAQEIAPEKSDFLGAKQAIDEGRDHGSAIENMWQR
jgi:hypothetical protein